MFWTWLKGKKTATLSETNIALKLMVGRRSFSFAAKGLFSGALAVTFRECKRRMGGVSRLVRIEEKAGHFPSTLCQWSFLVPLIGGR